MIPLNLVNVLATALDELRTFRALATEGTEFNPNVAKILAVDPHLYTLIDFGIILISWIADRSLRDRINEIWLIWASVGIVRLICTGWVLV